MLGLVRQGGDTRRFRPWLDLYGGTEAHVKDELLSIWCGLSRGTGCKCGERQCSCKQPAVLLVVSVVAFRDC